MEENYEKIALKVRIGFIVMLLLLIAMTTCSAQTKETLTKVSNDVALETGSSIVYEFEDPSTKSFQLFLKPTIWDAHIDMHNLGVMFKEKASYEQMLPWKYANHDIIGPNFATIVEYNKEPVMIMLVPGNKLIIVSDLPPFRGGML